jgi:hypothetical protein
VQKIGIHKRRNGTTRIGHEGGREEGTQIISLKRFCCDHNSKKGQAQTEIKGEEGDLKIGTHDALSKSLGKRHDELVHILRPNVLENLTYAICTCVQFIRVSSL